MAEDRKIIGYRIDLTDDRHVFVAQDGERMLIQFRSPEGKLTRMALSKEAADALQYLLGKHIPQEEMVNRFLVYMTNATEQVSQMMAWKFVVPDVAPEVGNASS